MRRRQWEARLQAMETARAVGILFGGPEPDVVRGDGHEYRGGERVVTADALLGIKGLS